MNRIPSIAVLLMTFVFCDSVEGQLFGTRSVRRSLNRQTSDGVGQVQGNERFVRGRRQDSFVGADQREMQGFVGNEQGRTSGRIASPTGGIKQFVDRSASINRPYPQLKQSDIYPGPIILPAQILNRSRTPAAVSELNRKLTLELNNKVNDSIEVWVVNRTANLRGAVSSAARKNLAELLLRFEPGIDEVRNELVVVDP